MSGHLWHDRDDAGLQLAKQLGPWRETGANTTLVALPRGGVAVGAAMAHQLKLPLVTWAVRKLTLPSNPEYGLGALAPGGVVVWSSLVESLSGEAKARLRANLAEESKELARRQRLFGDPDPSELAHRTLIVVDDGIATGLTVRAALASLRQCNPTALVLAVPVVDQQLVPVLEPLVDALICLKVVKGLHAVGAYYTVFDQLSDAKVISLLRGG